MESLQKLLEIFLHLDVHLNDWAATLGPWLYLVLFAIVFCETGLVVTPFLPGDSLLFAVGALAASANSPLNIYLLMFLLFLAAVLGDFVNYYIGYFVGPKVFSREDSSLLNKKHLVRTQHFYDRYGGKTIILARFIPIIRTFAPFVAGIGKMRYRRFYIYNIVGGACWVVAFLAGGYSMGNIPAVKSNFHYVIVAIIVISVLPPVIEFLMSRRKNHQPEPMPVHAE